jgi:hypothetical protein
LARVVVAEIKQPAQMVPTLFLEQPRQQAEVVEVEVEITQMVQPALMEALGEVVGRLALLREQEGLATYHLLFPHKATTVPLVSLFLEAAVVERGGQPLASMEALG